MKTISFIAALLVSTYAMACPQIAGTYTCDYGDGPEVLTIQQTVKSGVTEYLLDGDSYLADGQAYAYSDEGFSGTTTTACAGQTVSSAIVGDLLENGSAVGNLNVTVSYTPSATGLNSTSVGQLVYGGQTYPINDSISCTKN